MCVGLTPALCLGGSGLEAGGTLADVGPQRVDAFSVRTWVPVTFVVVWGKDIRVWSVSAT